MIHPDTKILAEILIHPLTSEQRQCIVRVCNLLNDLQRKGTGTATEEAGFHLDRPSPLPGPSIATDHAPREAAMSTGSIFRSTTSTEGFMDYREPKTAEEIRAMTVSDLLDWMKRPSGPGECTPPKREKGRIVSTMKDKMEYQMALKIEAIRECERLQARVAELELGWEDVLLALGDIRKNALSQIDGMNSMGVPDAAPEREAALWYYNKAHAALMEKLG